MSLVSFREYDKIEVVEKGALDKQLTVAELDALDAVAKRLKIPIIKYLNRRVVQPAQYVGTVCLPGRTVEFLPKIERSKEDGAMASDLLPRAVVRHNLLKMLLVAYDLEGASPGLAALEKSSDSWLDILMRLFAQALADQLRRGLVRRYRVETDDLPTIRGRLQIEEQLRRNIVHRERLACEFDEFDEDHALNQLFRVAIKRMLLAATSNATQQALRELMPAFEGVSDVEPSPVWLDSVKLDRLSERFALPLGMAKLFLRGATTRLHSGDQNSFALLFDMNKLFEKFVARTLRKHLRGKDFEVSIQDKSLYLVQGKLFQLQPDIVIRKGEKIYCVVDTKWKRLSPEENKLGIAQGDLYQMLAYAECCESDAVLLVYPWNPDGGPHESVRKQLKFAGGRKSVVTVGEVALDELAGVGERLVELLSKAVDEDLTVKQ